MSVRQWRLAKRNQLARTTGPSLWAHITGLWLSSAMVIAVFSFLAGIFLISNQRPVQPVLMAMVWTALVSMIASFVAIALGKHWQGREGDWPLRSFVQLTSGFAVGAVAYLLANYLMVWPGLSDNLAAADLNAWRGDKLLNIKLPFTEAHSMRHAAFTDGHNMLLPAYLAFFPLLMGLVGWWKQVDPLRRTRFSVWLVIWSMLVASLVQKLVPFPQPWCALIAGSMSVAIQLASPWMDSQERLAVADPDQPTYA